jgi:hypothetical protein
VEDFFFKLGRKAGAGIRKGRWIWTSLTGSEAEALEAEYRAGCDLARAFDRETRLDDDPRSRELLARIGERLTARLTNEKRRWRLVPTWADEPGAFALPGGFLYLTRPLLELCRFDETRSPASWATRWVTSCAVTPWNGLRTSSSAPPPAVPRASRVDTSRSGP